MQMLPTEDVTEKSKASDPLSWVQHMDMEELVRTLQNHVVTPEPNFGDGESVLTLLYEAYADCSKMDDGTIKADFNELYRLMNGMELPEMDKIIYPVCTLWRYHQRSGFIEGVKVGLRLEQELSVE